MKNILGNSFYTVILAVVLTIGGITWLIASMPVESFDEHTSDIGAVDGIEKMEMEFKNQEMVLNIRTNRSITCEYVIKSLGIHPIDIRGRIYTPACKIINKSTMQVVYKEVVSV